jgi:hypothetical protein
MIELIQIITILPVLAKMKSLQNVPTPTPAYRNRVPCDSHLMKYHEIRTIPQFTANKRKKTMMRRHYLKLIWRHNKDAEIATPTYALIASALFSLD